MGTRQERDSMGEVTLPEDAYWGAQTQRAIDNFTVSPLRIPPLVIKALGIIKAEASRANHALGLLTEETACAIKKAADEVIAGKWNDQFPVDVFQTGSGTSWNMNANEVIANRANQILGHPLGQRQPVHPNDHVNKGQSSNDVIPTTIHIANRMALDVLLAQLRLLHEALEEKTGAFSSVLKLGRTHLQDAVPMTLGQEFGGFSNQIEKAIVRIEASKPHLEELALGGTAIGTGLNAHPEFAERAIKNIAQALGTPFRKAVNAFEAIATRDAQVALMGALNSVSVSLFRIANDLRLLASGPRSGFGEITLPALQPGSSIMPGKVNPVIPEMVIQIAAFVSGKTVSVSMAGQTGPLELNMMHPLIAHETITSIRLLGNASHALATKCIRGIEADKERCNEWIENSLAMVTPLATKLGYDRAAALAHKAYREKRTIREVVKEAGLLSQDEIEQWLDPEKMISNAGR